MFDWIEKLFSRKNPAYEPPPDTQPGQKGGQGGDSSFNALQDLWRRGEKTVEDIRRILK